MSDPIYLGIDLGTQSVRALAVDDSGHVLASASHPLTSQRDGVRHQQEPEAWWAATAACCRSVTQALGAHRDRIAGVAIDATSGTIVIVDDNLTPLTPALMYNDGRAIAEAGDVNRAGEALWSRLSYRMQPSWALPKLCWLTRNFRLPATARLAHQNDFVNTRLAGRLLPTDSSHSLKTGYDLIASEWPASILEELGLSHSLFPEVVPPGRKIGTVSSSSAEETGLPYRLPIFSGMTDGCAAQIASGSVTSGSWNSVLGTTLVIKGVTTEMLHDPLGVVYSHRSTDNYWLPGGASNTGAGVIARDFPPERTDALNHAAAAAGPSQLIAYPLAGQGERFPFAAPDAEGFFPPDSATEEERYGAVLQGIALLERLCFDSLRQLGAPMHGALTFTGGATRSHAWNQIRADILEREVFLPEITEGAFGMAMLIAAQSSSLASVAQRMIRMRETISPRHDFSAYARQYETFVHELVSRGWLPAATAAAARQGAAA